jgi:hypothetical protein
METKLLFIVGLALAVSAPLARAQEEWQGERRERMERLREACENGDDRACEHLRHMRHEEREEREQREYQGERGGGAPPPVADPKVALCAAIENNYNNCLKHQHDGCPTWVVELKTNHCF